MCNAVHLLSNDPNSGNNQGNNTELFMAHCVYYDLWGRSSMIVGNVFSSQRVYLMV